MDIVENYPSKKKALITEKYHLPKEAPEQGEERKLAAMAGRQCLRSVCCP
ncbi:hypothetical protein HYU14_01085 [Candidatus Woesearchaeota archaeon]|nr:hypothetical protein [Candidatus Woesearchaeota archaeon]